MPRPAKKTGNAIRHTAREAAAEVQMTLKSSIMAGNITVRLHSQYHITSEPIQSVVSALTRFVLLIKTVAK